MGGKKGKKKSKKKKTKTKAQRMAVANKAKYGGTAKAAAANKASMRAKAKSYTKTSGAATAAAKNKASMQAKAKAKFTTSQANKALAKAGGTSAQVAKDNKKYGNTVPAGSFGISAAGKQQAAANRAEAAAKRTVPAGSFNISAAGRKQAEANKAAAAAKAQAEAKSAAESRRLAAENARRIAAERAAAKAEADRVAAAKRAAEKAEAERKRKAEEKRQRQFDPRRLDATATLKTNPLTDNNYFNLGRNVRIPNEDTASFRKLFKDDLSQVTRTDKAFKEGATGVKGFRPLKAFTPDMLKTGPTPLVRQTAERFLPAGLRNISLGSQIFNQGREDSGLTQSLNRVGNTNLGGLSIGFKSPESTDLGARAGKFLSSTFDKVAGGLNIGGSAQASEGGVDSGDPTARVSGFKSVKPIGIAKEAVQGFGDILTGQRTDFDKLGRLGFGATTDKLKDAAANMRINEVTDTLKKSPIRQAAVGFNYGIDVPDAIKQVDETRSVLNKTFKDFKGRDIDLGNIKPGSLDKNVKAEDLRGGISNVLYNLDRMPTLARGLSAFNTETDGGGDKEFRKDLRFTFNRKVDAPTGVPGRDLMKATTPGIVNRVLSGKLKDMGQEAITQNNLTGGMTADKFDTIASTLNKNLKTESTIANTRKKELTALAKRFGPGGGQAPTPKSILGGVNPFRGSNRGGGTTTAPRFQNVGGGTPVGQVPQIPATTTATPVPQFQVPELPVQQGTDAGNLANIQNESYQNTFKNLMAINPNYMARFQMRRRGNRRGGFRKAFSRRFFS